MTALAPDITSVEEFLAKVGAPDELILGCAVTKTHRDDDMDKDVSSIFHSVHFLEVHCKQLTNMDAFLEFVTSDTPKPAPNTASSNHAASDSPDPSSTP